MIVLGIETSCDETAVAVLEDGGRILANSVYSQADLHAEFGGVVPEVASRDHLRKLPYLAEEALGRAGIRWADVELVGVTRGPGLVGPLLVGLAFAKGVAFARRTPLAGVNHLAAHLFAHRLAFPQAGPPLLGVIVSGGHTSLVEVRNWGHYRVVGRTLDDAAGEALDKFGRLVGLTYPAGPEIDRLAKGGDPAAVPFPRPMLESGLDFSFAGLKTAAVYWLRDHPHHNRADLCAAYLEAVVDVLCHKAVRAARRLDLARVAVVGGVAANTRLRQVLPQRGAEFGLEVYFPPASLCTDNAAMVAACAHHRYAELGQVDDMGLGADPGLSLP
ncbi:MAG: tRNA (adenosine(37)-N6)-threonylcarbamoyltransferase complex transferase subunit TsaD [Candidatus Bipolaricaulaceae bacterium]